MAVFIELDVYDDEDGSSKVIYINTSQIEAFGDSGTLPADVYEEIPRIQSASFVTLISGALFIVSNSPNDICGKLNPPSTSSQPRIE